MIERTDDLWLIYDTEPWAICCVTTNGFVRNGKAVMGRGVARQAAQRWPDLPARLGQQLGRDESEPGPFGSAAPPYYGNHVQFIGYRLVSFPVKPCWGTSDGRNVVSHAQGDYPPHTRVPGYLMRADPGLIARSLGELAWMYHNLGWDQPLRDRQGEITHPFGGGVYLPCPGCGAGELDWETLVKPLCQHYGDWLVIVDRLE
jgi:hypothetical protein